MYSPAVAEREIAYDELLPGQTVIVERRIDGKRVEMIYRAKYEKGRGHAFKQRIPAAPDNQWGYIYYQLEENDKRYSLWVS